MFMFGRFTERAQQVLVLSQEEAKRLNHNFIGTEHLLLGLVREGSGIAARALQNMSVDLNRVRSEVEGITPKGEKVIQQGISYTPRAKRVVELAIEESQNLGHNYVGTEHLMLGLVREGEGIAAQVLSNMGIDLKRARPFQYPGVSENRDTHTTHFVAADQWGNIVCATQTLGNAFGSRIMPEGTGIWLNNSLAYCTFEPEGNPMDAHAGHHKLSGDCPTLIIKHGKPWAALGTPGGHTIGQTVPQMVINLIDFEMDIQKAINAPRISFIEPNYLAVEKGISKEVQESLKQWGHDVREVQGLGNAHSLTIQYNSRGKPIRFTGGADPRGEGLAKGF